MSGRGMAVLSRFPVHFDAPRRGKQLSVVADAVSSELDELSASLAAIRRAHRLGHADATTDLRRHGALHRIAANELAALDRRVDGLAAATVELRRARDANDAAARDAGAELLCDLLGVPGPAPRLALFAPTPEAGEAPDLAAGAAALVEAAASLTDFVGRRESIRARIRALCFIHARGNGTIGALLEAAASALDLELDHERARSFKRLLRPTVTVTPQGTPGSTRYAYVVVARSSSKNVDRQSVAAETATGNATLSDTDANLVAWNAPPDARDYLVFRVANGADPAAVGLLTPVALDPSTTSFRDTGQAVTAGVLDPEQDDLLFHSRDRFWHAAFVRERTPIHPTVAADEVIGMEENPVRREPPDTHGTPPDTPRTHGELFPVYRRGFGRSLLRIQIKGMGNRCVGPMLVNRDEGRGIGFAGIVPDGEVLIFDEAGHATLGGTDVTASTYAWTGACFASNDDDPAAPHDLLFDGPGVPAERRAVFAVAMPFDALDGAFVFPGAGDPRPVPGIGVGRMRFAFFVQEAHFSATDESVEPAVPIPLSPRPHAGFLDGSVFAPPPAADQAPAGSVSLSWLEHEAYALRLLLPRRFLRFDLPGQPSMADLVGRALERHRPAGVEVRVEYVEDRWILGASDVTAAEAADPILGLRGGSVLWASPDH